MKGLPLPYSGESKALVNPWICMSRLLTWVREFGVKADLYLGQ